MGYDLTNHTVQRRSPTVATILKWLMLRFQECDTFTALLEQYTEH